MKKLTCAAPKSSAVIYTNKQDIASYEYKKTVLGQSGGERKIYLNVNG